MSKGIFFALFAFVFTVYSSPVCAQWITSGTDIYYSGGRVGLGTSSPISGLSIETGLNAAAAPLSAAPNGSIWIGGDGTNGGISIGQFGTSYGYIQSRNKSTQQNGYNLIFNPLGGNIGVGKTNPSSRFHVSENSTATDVSNGITIEQNGTGDAVLQFLLVGLRRWTMGIDNSDDDSFKIAVNTGLAASPALTILTGGNVGIGTVDPTDKLSVMGRIRAQEVKVEMANWPDFVFKKGYVLPTLQETEKHINEKGYLPGIPSAAEAEKNGIELGDMNKKLLQKIEELTLHLIEQGKRIDASDEKIRSQQVEIGDQKATVIQLQRKLEKLTEK